MSEPKPSETAETTAKTQKLPAINPPPPQEDSEEFLAQQEEVNNRVLDRAGQVLTPDQLQKFGPLLKGQLDMQKASLKMAQEMFKGGNDAQLSPPQPTPSPQ